MKKMQYIANFTENLLDNDSVSSANTNLTQLNSQFNNQLQSSSNLFSKPYSVKSNFSNVIKIDKKSKKSEISVDNNTPLSQGNEIKRFSGGQHPDIVLQVKANEQPEIMSTSSMNTVQSSEDIHKTLADKLNIDKVICCYS